MTKNDVAHIGDLKRVIKRSLKGDALTKAMGHLLEISLLLMENKQESHLIVEFTSNSSTTRTVGPPRKYTQRTSPAYDPNLPLNKQDLYDLKFPGLKDALKTKHLNGKRVWDYEIAEYYGMSKQALAGIKKKYKENNWFIPGYSRSDKV